MRWEDERYVRIYTRDTPDWLAMQWQGRVVFYELARKVDRAGFIGVGKSGIRGLAGCLHMPVEVVEAGVNDLIADGCVQRVEGGYLIRNFLEAQETPQSDKARKRTQRERDRDSKRATAAGDETSRGVTDGHEVTAPVTNRDATSQNVTESHAASRRVTPRHAASLHTVPSRAVPCSADPEISPPPAGARAREDDAQAHAEPATFAGAPPPPGIAIATDETLLVAVARHPMLATLHGDRRWAQNASSGFMTGAVRAADVDAAVEAFVTGEAAKAPEHPEALARWVRDNIGRYLKKSKQHGDEARVRAEREASRRRERPPEPRSPDAQAVLETFGAVWAARKRRAFVPATTDERHAEDIGRRARAAARDSESWLDVVRHWAVQHLGSQDRLVVDSDHALRTMGMQLTAYGLPKKAPPRDRPSEPSAIPFEPAPPPADLGAGLATTSHDGAVIRRPRPAT